MTRERIANQCEQFHSQWCGGFSKGTEGCDHAGLSFTAEDAEVARNKELKTRDWAFDLPVAASSAVD
jgi:hypothetical protein